MERDALNQQHVTQCNAIAPIKYRRSLLVVGKSTGYIGVRAGGARGAVAPPNFGQLRFFGQQEKICAKTFLKTFLCFFY